MLEAAAMNKVNEIKTINGYPIKKGATPVLMSPVTYRNYSDYLYSIAYSQGWNDAMKSIFELEEKKK